MLLKKLRKILTQECKHEWVEEGPTEEVCGLLIHEGPRYRCRKCHQTTDNPISKLNKPPQ